jgi:uncharacterized protein YggE
MTIRLCTAAVFAIVLSGTPVAAEEFPSAISVSGEATVSATPDLAQIDAGVATEAKTAKEASDTNNAAMGKVLLALKSAGIDEKDYQTSRLSLQPQYANTKTPDRATSIASFRASNRVTVKIRDVTKVAGVIDTLVGAGANDVGNISFEVTQASTLLDGARQRALEDARRKAEIYAKAAGVTLGTPISISEGGGPMPLFKTRVAAPMAAAAVPVAPGEETLSVSVNVSWSIKPPQPQQ